MVTPDEDDNNNNNNDDEKEKEKDHAMMMMGGRTLSLITEEDMLLEFEQMLFKHLESQRMTRPAAPENSHLCLTEN